MTVLFYKKEFSMTPGVIGSFVVYAGTYTFYFFNGFKDPQLYLHIINLSVLLVFSYILNLNLEVMVTKRNDFYQEDDWLLGFVHLQTDWTFKLWYDYFTKDNWDEGVLDRDRELEKDRQTPIHITVDDGEEVDDRSLSDSDDEDDVAR